MSFALSVLEHDIVKAEVFVSLAIKLAWFFYFCNTQQDNSGALLQDEEYIITGDSKSGVRPTKLYIARCSTLHPFTVQHKENGFQSNLARAAATARVPKEL